MPTRTPFAVRDRSYELLDYIERRLMFEEHQALWLGGAPGSPGSNIPPGGYIGCLPQDRVQWDPDEKEYWSGGSTLKDNLARDRMRLTTYMKQLAYPNSQGSTISAGSFPSWGSGASIVGFSSGSPPSAPTVQDALQYLWNTRFTGIENYYTWHTFVFSVDGDLEIATGKLQYAAPGPMTISEVYTRIVTAPVGQDAIVDVNKNGTTILDASKITIQDGDNSAVTVTPTVTTLAKNDYLTMDVDQIGTTTPGADLAVHVRCKQYLQED
jgi:hypothetical protein